MPDKQEEQHLTNADNKGKDEADKRDVEQGDADAVLRHKRDRFRNKSGDSIRSFGAHLKEVVTQPFIEESPPPRKYVRSQSYEVSDTTDPESCHKLLRRSTAHELPVHPEHDEETPLASADEDSLGPQTRERSFSVGSQFRVRSVSISRSDYHLDLKGSLKAGLTRNLLLTTFVIVFGSSWQFGYNISVLNNPKQLITSFYNETYAERNDGTPMSPSVITLLWSLTTALYLPGGMIGSFSAGFIADRFGRKKGILLSHIPALIGAGISTACVAAKAPELVMVGRFFTGINCGLATGLAPMYISEITPFNLRGAIGTVHQLFITIGIFAASVFGLKQLLGTPTLWPYLLLFNAFPALVSLAILPFLPESPRWLFLIKKDEEGARKALKWFRRTEHVGADMEEMDTENQDKMKVEKFTLMQLFRSVDLRMPLLVACMLQVIQQFSGINAIFFYSSGIFANAGVSEAQIPYAVIGTNAINVIMTVVAVSLMDKAGRRPLLLVPMFTMIGLLVLLSVTLNLQGMYHWMSYLSVIAIIGYVICFAVGLGPIPTMVGAELFRQGPRPMAMSSAGLTNWLFTFIIAMSFESVQEVLKAYTFLIFLGLMIVFTVFVWFKVPETKNKTFEEIAHQFAPGSVLEVDEIQDEVFAADANEGPDSGEDHRLVTLNFDKGSQQNSSVPDKGKKSIPLKDMSKNHDKNNHVVA